MVKHFRQVSAHFPVDLNGLRDPAEVFAGGAVGYIDHRFAQVPPDPGFINYPGEFLCHGRIRFPGRGVYCPEEAMTRAHTAGEHLDGVGQLFVELGTTTRSANRKVGHHSGRNNRQQHEREEESSEQKADDGPNKGAGAHHQQEVSRLGLEPRTLQLVAVYQEPASALEALVDHSHSGVCQPCQST